MLFIIAVQDGFLTFESICVFFFSFKFGDLTLVVMISVSGARSSHSSILVKLQELNEARATLQSKNSELQQVIKELDTCKKVADK